MNSVVDATHGVGEFRAAAGSAAAAVIIPGANFALPQATMRNLRSLALVRLLRGPIWILSVVGYRWTPERLAIAAAMLEAHGEADPDVVLTNRLSDQLGLPNLRIEHPTMADLDGSGWNVRPLAVALGLARAFSDGSASHGAITSADTEELVVAIRRSLNDAMARFRSELDPEALARCKSCGESAQRVYNYLTSVHRRNRLQFAGALPVFLQAVASCQNQSPYREMRQAIDASQPLARMVCRATGVDPSVFRALAGLSIELCGARWLETPVALMKLINVIRPDRRPGQDPVAWQRLRALVDQAESVTGRQIDQSLVAQMWVRDAMQARASGHAEGSAAAIDSQASALVQNLREEIYAAVGVSQLVRAKVQGAGAHDGLYQVIDRWLLQRTRRQLSTLAARWQDAYAAEKAGDASMIACMRGERYWALLPSPFTSSDGRRRVVPLVSRQQLVKYGTEMANCLEEVNLQGFDAACRGGGTFVVGLVDGESGAPRSTAEFRLKQDRDGTRMVVEVVQHTARKNAVPGEPCKTTMKELLLHVQCDAVQGHLRLGVTAVRASRRKGASAITAAQRATRLRALKLAVGDQSFDDLWQRCEQERQRKDAFADLPSRLSPPDLQGGGSP